MIKKVIGDMSEWSGLLKDFYRQIDDRSITYQMLSDFVQHKNPFPESEYTVWKRFYRDHFNIRTSLTSFRIPHNPGGFKNVMFVIPLNIEQVLDKIQEHFAVFIDTRAKEIVFTDQDVSDEPYAIRISKNLKDTESLYEEYITLKEILIYDFKYFLEKDLYKDLEECDKHIDIIKNGFNIGKLKIYWNTQQSKLHIYLDYNTSRKVCMVVRS